MLGIVVIIVLGINKRMRVLLTVTLKHCTKNVKMLN